MKTKCDFCGEYKDVVITHYGTTHYNRIICQDCIKKINQYHRETLGELEDVINNDGSLRGEGDNQIS